MPRSRVLVVSLLALLTVSTPALADVITDLPPDQEEAPRQSTFMAHHLGGALFDFNGLPLLLTTAPIYLHLPPRIKLRHGWGGDGTEPESGALLQAFTSQGGSNSNPNNPGGTPDGNGQPGGTVFRLTDDNTPQVPEPAVLLLMAPTAGLIIWTRRRRLSRTGVRTH